MSKNKVVEGIEKIIKGFDISADNSGHAPNGEKLLAQVICDSLELDVEKIEDIIRNNIIYDLTGIVSKVNIDVAKEIAKAKPIKIKGDKG